MAKQPAIEHVGFISRSAEQTGSFGFRLGQKAMPGDLILLRGPFGAGKTTLVQGLAAALGIEEQVTSPSFTLINQYHGRIPLFHVDLFRLEVLDLELEQAIECCQESEGLTVVEWPDLLPPDLREGALRIDMETLEGDDRSIVAHTEGSRWSADDLVAMMEEALRGSKEAG